jgi:hypothetical protein
MVGIQVFLLTIYVYVCVCVCVCACLLRKAELCMACLFTDLMTLCEIQYQYEICKTGKTVPDYNIRIYLATSCSYNYKTSEYKKVRIVKMFKFFSASTAVGQMGKNPILYWSFDVNYYFRHYTGE